MLFVDVIRAKRDGAALSAEQIAFFVRGLADGSIPSEQVSALAMAICLRSMSFEEAGDPDPCDGRFRNDSAVARRGPGWPGSRQAFHGGHRRQGEFPPGADRCSLWLFRADDFRSRSRAHRRYARQDRQHSRLSFHAGSGDVPEGGQVRRLRHHRADRRSRPGGSASLRDPGRHWHRGIDSADHGLDPVKEDRRRAGRPGHGRQGRLRGLHGVDGTGTGPGPQHHRDGRQRGARDSRTDHRHE